MNIGETEVLGQIAKYADLLTGFAVAQTLAYIYALGKEEKFRERVQLWRNMVLLGIVVSGAAYQVFIIFLAVIEGILRDRAGQSGLVIVTMLAIAIGRMAIIGSCTVLTVFVTRKTGMKDAGENLIPHGDDS